MNWWRNNRRQKVIELFDNDDVITALSCYAHNSKKKVYVVGGAVRDFLLKKRACGVQDIDLAGDLDLQEMLNFIEEKGISQFEIKNKKLQVLSFRIGEDKIYEYARLRKEVYQEKDTHTPSKVEFVSEVSEDAKRRDFTINSVYYDRHSSAIIDPVGGIDDLKGGVVRPVLGEETFKVDPARIIRFIELLARFDLSASQEVLDWAKKYAQNVGKLKQERLNKETLRLQISEKYLEEDSNYLRRVKTYLKELNLQNVIKIDNKPHRN